MSSSRRKSQTWIEEIAAAADHNWRWSGDVLVRTESVETPGRSFYEAVGGVEQHAWSTDPATASHYDAPRYRALVERTVAIGGSRLGADLGCGDGRITSMLLDCGVDHVIALDFFATSVERLAQRLDGQQHERVLPAVGAVESPPITPGRCDVVTCVEVLCTLPDRSQGLRRISDWLRPGGTALIVEPAVEGSATYAMLAGDDEQIEKVLSLRRRDDRIGDGALEVTLSTRESLRSEVVQAGLSVAHEESLPAGAALLIAHMRRTYGSVPSEWVPRVAVADTLGGMPPRMHAVVVVKATDDAIEPDSQ